MTRAGWNLFVLDEVVDGDAPFVHLVGIDRGDGVGVERDGDDPVGLLVEDVRRERHQRLSRIEIERPCASSPSVSARVTAAGASSASEAGSQPSSEVRFMKSSTPRPEAIAGRAGGGQHVVGAADIVADGLGRVVAEKDRAGVADLRLQRQRIVEHQLDVLGGDAVGELDRFGQRLHEDDGAELAASRRG